MFGVPPAAIPSLLPPTGAYRPVLSDPKVNLGAAAVPAGTTSLVATVVAVALIPICSIPPTLTPTFPVVPNKPQLVWPANVIFGAAAVVVGTSILLATETNCASSIVNPSFPPAARPSEVVSALKRPVV